VVPWVSVRRWAASLHGEFSPLFLAVQVDAARAATDPNIARDPQISNSMIRTTRS